MSTLREDRWLEQYNQLKEFYQKHGHTGVTYSNCRHKSLADWVRNQRRCCKMESRIELLNAIEFDWSPSESLKKLKVKEDQWLEKYNQLKEFCQKHGHTGVTYSNCRCKSLADWVRNQRRCCKMESRIELLNAIEFDWSPSTQKFKNDENKPANVKNDAEVENKFIFDLDDQDDVGVCEVWNFIEATISSHNKGKATATKSKSSISKNNINAEKNVSQPDDGGWGANMFMQEDEWKCEGCSAINKNTHKKCQSCRMPRDATSYEGVKYDDDDADDNDDRSGSDGAISATGFSFGAANTTTAQPTPSSDKKRKSDYDEQQQSSKSLFTFGGSATAATTTTPGTGFTFGAKQSKEDATKPKSTVFSFGAAPPKTETINMLKSPSTNENATSTA